MVEEKDLTIMKYIRTYETEEKFLTDKDSTSRGFRLKPTLYKYSEAGDHVHLELDDPRKHGDSTYMEITLDSDTEFSFYIGNRTGDTQTTMTCSIDWGDGTVENKTITKDDKGFKLAHNYVAGSYKIELYNVERDYIILGYDGGIPGSLISHPSSIKRVVLGSGSSIGNSVFYCCESLTSVNIPDSVTSIGSVVFFGCSSLTSINIPESVTRIEPVAFAGCTGLTSINIPESVVSIGQGAFVGCTGLTSINIPESVTSIGTGAFLGCSSLTSINIPESVVSIGQGAFGDCNRLTSVTLPNTNNATIHPDTFKGAGVATIDSVSYGVGTSELTVGNYTFNDTSFLTFYLNGNSYSYVGSIDSVAVYSCDRSKSGGLIIPSTISYNGTTYNVTSIRNNAFNNCTSLTSINIPEGVTSIRNNAFNNCTSLTSINIPEGVTSIGGSAFNNCTSLTSINIPEGVTSIGDSAFDGCSSLTSINIPESVTSIGGNAFNNCTSLTSISIPENITSIGNGIFSGCKSLTSISIPESVTSIGSQTFNSCTSLTSINIPEGVTSIKDYAFYYCSSLSSISSLNTTAPTLGNKVFTNLPTNGILHIKPGATGYDVWLDNLPEGWTIVEDL